MERHASDPATGTDVILHPRRAPRKRPPFLYGRACDVADKAATLRPRRPNDEEPAMHIHVALQPLIALIAGLLILVMPRLLNYVVALYLIIVGLIGLLPLLRL
jgi:hypothetical protein